MELTVNPTISRGAIASVLCTVIGAIALTAGFGAAISSAVVGCSPSDSLTADITVSWAENEGANRGGIRRREIKSVEDSDKDFFVIAISRYDLGFDAIEIDAEGWPPDLGTPYNNGLNSYTINITVKGAAGLLPTTSPCYIARTKLSASFYVLVPRSGTLFSESQFKGMKCFPATAEGVVNLAKAEKLDGAR